MYQEPEQELLISTDNRTLSHEMAHQQPKSQGYRHSSTKQNNLHGNRKDPTTEVAQGPQQTSQQGKGSIFYLKKYQSSLIEPELLKQIRDIQCEKIFRTQAIAAPSLSSFVMRRLIDYHKKSLEEIISKVTQDNYPQYLSAFRAHLRQFYVTEHMLQEYFAELTKEELQKLLNRKADIEYDRQRLRQFRAYRFFKEEYKRKDPQIELQAQQKQSKVICSNNQIQKSRKKEMEMQQIQKGRPSKFWSLFSSNSEQKTE